MVSPRRYYPSIVLSSLFRQHKGRFPCDYRGVFVGFVPLANGITEYVPVAARLNVLNSPLNTRWVHASELTQEPETRPSTTLWSIEVLHDGYRQSVVIGAQPGVANKLKHERFTKCLC